MALTIEKAKEVCNYDLIDESVADIIDEATINGDETVLTNPIYDVAFDKMLNLHKVNSPISFMSLCTGKRPYNKSTKWKYYMEAMGPGVDYLVTSNGGLFPEEIWNDFLCLTYNSPKRESGSETLCKNKYKKTGYPKIEMKHPKWYEGVTPTLTTKEVDTLYKQKLYDRMIRFYTIHRYDYIFGDFVPEQRNYSAFIEAAELLKSLGMIKGYDTPALDIKKRCETEGYLLPYGRGRMMSTLHTLYQREMLARVNVMKRSAGIPTDSIEEHNRMHDAIVAQRVLDFEAKQSEKQKVKTVEVIEAEQAEQLDIIDNAECDLPTGASKLSLNISLSGSQGTGKSTLVNLFLKDNPNYKEPLNISRFFNEKFEKFGINKEADICSQSMITGFMAYDMLTQSNLIHARNIIDTFAYATHSPKISPGQLLDIQLIYTPYLNELYDIIFYVPIEFDATEDGTRITDIVYRKQIDDYIITYLTENDIKFHTLSGTVEERYNEMKRVVNEYQS